MLATLLGKPSKATRVGSVCDVACSSGHATKPKPSAPSAPKWRSRNERGNGGRTRWLGRICGIDSAATSAKPRALATLRNVREQINESAAHEHASAREMRPNASRHRTAARSHGNPRRAARALERATKCLAQAKGPSLDNTCKARGRLQWLDPTRWPRATPSQRMKSVISSLASIQPRPKVVVMACSTPWRATVQTWKLRSTASARTTRQMLQNHRAANMSQLTWQWWHVDKWYRGHGGVGCTIK